MHLLRVTRLFTLKLITMGVISLTICVEILVDEAVFIFFSLEVLPLDILAQANRDSFFSSFV